MSNNNLEHVLSAGTYTPESAAELIENLSNNQLIAIGNTNFNIEILDDNQVKLTQANDPTLSRTLSKDELKNVLLKPDLKALFPEKETFNLPKTDTAFEGTSISEALEFVANLQPGATVFVNGELHVVEKNEDGDYITLKKPSGQVIDVAKNTLAASIVRKKELKVDEFKPSEEQEPKGGLEEKTPSTLEQEKAVFEMREKLQEVFTKGWEKLSHYKQLELLKKVAPEYAAKLNEDEATIVILGFLAHHGLDVPVIKTEDNQENASDDQEKDPKKKPKKDKDADTDPVPTKDPLGLPPHIADTPDDTNNDGEQLPENLKEEINPRIKIGTFVRPKNGTTIFEIINTFEGDDGTPMVAIQAFDDRGREAAKQITDMRDVPPMSVEDLEAGYNLYERKELLAEMQQDFLDKARDSFQNAGALEKFKFEVARMIKGEKMETGLSKEARESLDAMNSYLNKLISSAAREWQNKGKSPEEIKALSERYKAMFMSGVQLEATYDELYDEKIKNSETKVGKSLKWIKDKWAKVPTGVKVGLSIAGVAGLGFATAGVGAGLLAGSVPALGILGSSAATRKGGKTWGAWAGVGITQAMRGLMTGGLATPVVLGAALARVGLESMHVTKGDVAGMQNLRDELNVQYNNAENIKKQLAKEGLSDEQRNALQQQLRRAVAAFQNYEEQFKKQSGQFDQEMRSVEEQYNRGEITPKEYLAALEKSKTKDEIMETLKKGVSLFAIAAAFGSGIGGGGAEDGGDHTPEPEPVTPDPIDPEPVTPDPTYDSDAIVRDGEGITHVYKRQLDHDPELTKWWEEKLGMDYESNKGAFLAKLAKDQGYIDSAGNDVRVAEADVSAYELGKGTTHEFHKGSFVETHSSGAAFEKPVDGHEYSWDGSPQYKGGTDGSVDASTVDFRGADGSTGGTVDASTVDFRGADDAAGKVGAESVKAAGGTVDASTVDFRGADDAAGTGGTGVETTKVGPTEILSSKAGVSSDILQSFDKFDEGLSDREYQSLVNAPAVDYLGEIRSSDMTVDQQNLSNILGTIKENTGLEPLPYESAEQYIDRGLAELGSRATVAQIHEGTAYAALSLESAEFVGNTKQQTFNNFVDIFFEKSGGKWSLEGAESIDFKEVGSQPARNVFYHLEKGDVTPDSLRNDLGISGTAAHKLFDFFKQTKTLTEAHLDPSVINGNITIAEVVRKMTDQITERA